MRKKSKKVFNCTVAVFVLLSITGCNLNLTPNNKQRYSDSTIKTVVSKAIDSEMEFIKPNLEPEVQAKMDEASKGSGTLDGKQIVDLIMNEQSGHDYVEFCFAVEESTMPGNSDYVVDSARSLLTDSQYAELELRINEAEKRMNEFASEYAKGLPADQQHAFYKDLKSLVTRSVVLLTAGIVYMAIPDLILWGKISAAAAISIAAGLVSLSIMTIYENFKFKDDSNTAKDKTFKEWLEDLIAVPKADFAITTSVTAIATCLSESAVVKGIIIIVFACTNALDMLRIMLKKYNFNA